MPNERVARREFRWTNSQAQGDMKSWACKVRKFFISNQSPHLANVEQLHLMEMVIPNLEQILWEAEKVKWLTSIHREEAQYGVGKNKLRS